MASSGCPTAQVSGPLWLGDHELGVVDVAEVRDRALGG
jgi:hypothetical protein